MQTVHLIKFSKYAVKAASIDLPLQPDRLIRSSIQLYVQVIKLVFVCTMWRETKCELRCLYKAVSDTRFHTNSITVWSLSSIRFVCRFTG